MRVGEKAHQYEVIPDWGRGGEIQAFGLPTGVACDSGDRVYVSIREPRWEILVFDREGHLLDRWGKDFLYGPLDERQTFGPVGPHGIWIGPDDHIYLTHTGDHTVRKLTLDGEVVMTLGTPGAPGAHGAPFNKPTRAVEGPGGDLFISDGYGQNRVHRLTASGDLVTSWGEEGKGPGQFELPHDVTVDREGRVYILDRPNGRCQVFNDRGKYQAEHGGFLSPNDLFIAPDGTFYLAERGITILNEGWEILARVDVGGTHGIWVDSHGDIYWSTIGLDKFKKLVRV